jgi:hypothetical protein
MIEYSVKEFTDKLNTLKNPHFNSYWMKEDQRWIFYQNDRRTSNYLKINADTLIELHTNEATYVADYSNKKIAEKEFMKIITKVDG